MKFSDATGRQVVSTSTAATVGKIDEFVVDPQLRAVVAVTAEEGRCRRHVALAGYRRLRCGRGHGDQHRLRDRTRA